MKSRITVDLDEDNNPIIKIQYSYSEDVRDSLVKRFLEKFGSQSCWARFMFVEDDPAGRVSTSHITPITASQIPEQAKLMALYADGKAGHKSAPAKKS